MIGYRITGRNHYLTKRCAPNFFLSGICPTFQGRLDAWRPLSLAYLATQIILVTGGNSGIGYHTVKQCLLKNPIVYLAARSADKVADAINSLETETGKKAIFIQLDLAELSSVRKGAKAFLAKESRLDVRFNNGHGSLSLVEFGTDVVGHFLLTEILPPAITNEETGVPARIINVSSTRHRNAPDNGMVFASLKGGLELHPEKLYGQSNMGNICMSNYYNSRYSDVRVSCALHPGLIRSGLQR
ncbi:hypothetical protein B0H10DRAFT_2381894 [Mycena sp. CBHHK59/15]|nr:hypothetical protein B0H10DRAFT_2381894 [Mycena sp. CBHHK59/15]